MDRYFFVKTQRLMKDASMDFADMVKSSKDGTFGDNDEWVKYEDVQAEITELETLLKIKQIIITKKNKGIKRLSAQIERLRECLELVNISSGFKPDAWKRVMDKVADTYNETTTQSLAKIKADAIREMLNKIHAIPRYKDAMVFTSAVIKYADQLESSEDKDEIDE